MKSDRGIVGEDIHRSDMASAVRASPKLKRGASVIEACRFVLEHGYTRHRGKLIDAYTASAIVKVHDALNDENRAKYAAIDEVMRMSTIAFRLCK